MKTICILTILACVVLVLAGERREEVTPPVKPKPATTQFSVTPIGHVDKHAGRAFIRIDGRYQDGLLGFEQCSHIWVFYWFDRNDTPEKRSVLRVHPRGNRNNPITRIRHPLPDAAEPDRLEPVPGRLHQGK